MRPRSPQSTDDRDTSEKANERTLWVYNRLLIFSCLVGLGLSLYSYIVELFLEENKNYKPLCDVSEHMSCTKAFGSAYGKGFGIFDKGSIFYKPNSFYGIVFYSMVATFSLTNSPVAVNGSLFLIILSNFISLYVAYILYFILANLCVVCLGIYVVNVINLVLITRKHKKLRMITEEREKTSLSLNKKAD